MSQRVRTAETQRWPALRAGGRIALIAPSGPFDRDAFAAGVAVLQQRFEVDFDASIFDRDGYLAGDDARRAAEINQALRDPSVDALMAARGGYGAARVLTELDLASLGRQPKLLCGFSDITALHAQWTRMDIGSVHGPMVTTLGKCSPAMQARLLDALQGRFTESVSGLTPLTRGQASGPLFGGNLAVLTSLLGSPFSPPFADGVLFLEDVGERPYRVDRMLTSLLLGGQLAQVAAIVVGQFTDGPAGPDGVTLEAVLRERLSRLRCPVVLGYPSGHVDDNLELPLGRRVRVDADQGTVTLLAESAAG